MKTHRILTIGSRDFLLPEALTDAQALALATQLGGLREVDDQYLPSLSSDYADRVTVIVDEAPDIAVRVTAKPIFTRAEFDARKKQILSERGEKVIRDASIEEV